MHVDAALSAVREIAARGTPPGRHAARPVFSAAGDLRAVVDQLNARAQQSASSIRYSVDESTGRRVVRVVDSQSGELIRQMPSEEMLALSRAVSEMLRGWIVNEDA